MTDYTYSKHQKLQIRLYWDGLEETESGSIRYCSSCEKKVHYCKTDSELVNAIKKNQCVAIEKETDLDFCILRGVGMVDAPYSTDK